MNVGPEYSKIPPTQETQSPVYEESPMELANGQKLQTTAEKVDQVIYSEMSDWENSFGDLKKEGDIYVDHWPEPAENVFSENEQKTGLHTWKKTQPSKQDAMRATTPSVGSFRTRTLAPLRQTQVVQLPRLKKEAAFAKGGFKQQLAMKRDQGSAAALVRNTIQMIPEETEPKDVLLNRETIQYLQKDSTLLKRVSKSVERLEKNPLLPAENRTIREKAFDLILQRGEFKDYDWKNWGKKKEDQDISQFLAQYMDKENVGTPSVTLNPTRVKEIAQEFGKEIQIPSYEVKKGESAVVEAENFHQALVSLESRLQAKKKETEKRVVQESIQTLVLSDIRFIEAEIEEIEKKAATPDKIGQRDADVINLGKCKEILSDGNATDELKNASAAQAAEILVRYNSSRDREATIEKITNLRELAGKSNFDDVKKSYQNMIKALTNQVLPNEKVTDPEIQALNTQIAELSQMIQFSANARGIVLLRTRIESKLQEKTESLAKKLGVAAEKLRSIDFVKEQLKTAKGQKNNQTLLQEHLEFLRDVQTVNPSIVVQNEKGEKQILYQRRLRGLMTDQKNYKEIQSLPQKAKLEVMEDMARSMRLFQTVGLIHKDFAARNFVWVQKGNRFHAQLVDFDTIQPSTYQAKPGEVVPVKWVPPECLMNGRWTPRSEVWSLGISLTEILKGEWPYTNLHLDKVDLYRDVVENREVVRLAKEQNLSSLININAKKIGKGIDGLEIRQKEIKREMKICLVKCFEKEPSNRADPTEIILMIQRARETL